MKNHRHNDSGMRKTEHNTLKHENFRRQKNIGDKEEKETEE